MRFPDDLLNRIKTDDRIPDVLLQVIPDLKRNGLVTSQKSHGERTRRLH